jgi:Clostripain family
MHIHFRQNGTALLCICLSAFVARGDLSPSLGDMPPAAWTILVYMNANNNLERDAFTNFNQIARAPDNSAVNVVLQFARQAQYVPYPEWKGALRFKMKNGLEPIFENSIEKQTDPTLEESAIPNPNMGAAATLSDFIKWGMTTYPAKHYMLVIWDHGDGWRFFDTTKVVAPKTTLEVLAASRKFNLFKATELLKNTTNVLNVLPSQALAQNPGIPAKDVIQTSPVRAISVDDAHNGSKLYNREIEDALKGTLGGKKLDILGFDACLMAMMETAYAMRDVARVMVGSEELEPGKGWDYEKWLTPLAADPGMGPEELGKVLVQSYQAIYQSSGLPTTMSATNLESVPRLANAIDDFSSKLTTSLQRPKDLNRVKQVRDWCFVFAPGYGVQGVDFGQFSELIAQTTQDPKLQLAARTARTQLDATIIEKYMSTDRPQSYGLAIYFPANAATFNADPQKGAYDRSNNKFPIEFVQDNHWSNFIANYCKYVPK